MLIVPQFFTSAPTPPVISWFSPPSKVNTPLLVIFPPSPSPGFLFNFNSPSPSHLPLPSLTIVPPCSSLSPTWVMGSPVRTRLAPGEMLKHCRSSEGSGSSALHGRYGWPGPGSFRQVTRPPFSGKRDCLFKHQCAPFKLTFHAVVLGHAPYAAQHRNRFGGRDADLHQTAGGKLLCGNVRIVADRLL